MTQKPESRSQNGESALDEGQIRRYSGHHQPWMMCSMVAETKLSRPRLPHRLIEDETRLGLLDCAGDVPFTLLSAPAGFGKTTLVTQWLEDRKPAHAWLTIDARDDTPHLFWRSVSAALARVDPSLALRESTLLSALEPGAVVDPVALLVNRLSDYARTWQAPQRLFLILDDFHLIRQDALLEQVRRFIDFAPGLLRLICISRTDPPIRIAQLLAREQMLKLGADALCFNLELTGRFVRLRREDASTIDIARLHERTGGWPAALQLSAMSPSLDGAAGNSVANDGADALAAYLLEEVFDELDASLQQFLLDVSLLPLFSEAIADRARGKSDAARQIAAMREHNLLLQHFGSGQCWYRLHDLLAEWLRPRVDAGPHSRRIRMVAAEAFADLGLMNEALDLLVSEHCFEEAEALLPGLLLSDDLLGFRSLPDRFPPDFRRRSAALTILQALFSSMEGRFGKALELTESADALLVRQNGQDAETLRFVALLLRCMSSRFTGRAGAARESIRELSQRLETGSSNLHNWGLYILGVDASMDAELETAERILGRALAGALVSDDTNCVLRCLAVLIPVLIHQGRINEAVRCFNRTRDRLSGLPPLRDQEAMLAYLDGMLALERIQLRSARAILAEASRLAPERMNLMDQVYLAFESFRAAMIAGDESAWRSRLDDITELHQLMGGGEWTYNIPECPALQALASLRQGDASVLLAWSQRFDNTEARQSRSRFFQLNERLLLLLGRTIMGLAVDEDLERLVVDAKQGSNHLVVCHVRLMQVLLLAYRDGSRDQAAALLGETLQWCVPLGLLRPFVDADPTFDPVLEQCLHHESVAAFAREVIDLRRGVGEDAGSATEPPAASDDDTAIPLPEPLSQRERHVLRLLSQGLSNKVMSNQLGITVATVKSHLSNIYGKLDAGNRGRAVARARSLGLLE